MNERDHILLLRGLSDELSPDEKPDFEALIANNPEAKAEYQRLEELNHMLSTSAYDSFGPSFADRVMERVGRGEQYVRTTLADALASIFARVAPLGAAAAIILGVYNFVTFDAGQSPLEAAMGLQPVTVQTAYDAAFTDMIYPQQ